MAETPETARADAPEGVSDLAVLKDRFAVFPAKPLPDFDSPTARAYIAEDRRGTEKAPLFALVCSPGIAARTDAMEELKGAEVEGLLPLVEWGTTFWPPIGENVAIAIFRRPLGGRVLTAIAQGKTRLSEYDLQRRVIVPVSKALSSLAQRGVCHRAVRPENLFFLDDEYQDLVIGECISSPPGHDQPILYETIERGMAMPGGRGLGNASDDIYALGATLIVLHLGYNPVARMTEAEVFTAKVEQGSYATLCGSTRVPISLLEPLRGMLSDEAGARWQFEALSEWMGGKRDTPIQKRTSPKAETPYTFAGEEYATARMLAFGLSLNVPEAAKAIRTDTHLDTFIRKGLKNTDLADRIIIIAEQSKVNEKTVAGSDDILVTRVCIVLDPDGPIRYKGIAFMPDGYGSILASELMTSGSAQIPAEALLRDIHDAWFNVQNKADPERIEWFRTLTKTKAQLKINDPGHGLERALYDLNPGLPCQSPLIVRDYVTEPAEVLFALDRVSHDVDSKVRPLDRHLTAFIAARFSEDVHPHLRALASARESTSIIGTLSLLALLQWKLRTDRLYGLTSWVGSLLGPAINTYRSRPTRREIEREIPKIVRKGSLPELFDLIDNAEKRQVDADGFAEAQIAWQTAQEEIVSIEGDSGDRMKNAMRQGQQIAAVMSVMTSMAIVSVIFLLEAW